MHFSWCSIEVISPLEIVSSVIESSSLFHITFYSFQSIIVILRKIANSSVIFIIKSFYQFKKLCSDTFYPSIYKKYATIFHSKYKLAPNTPGCFSLLQRIGVFFGNRVYLTKCFLIIFKNLSPHSLTPPAKITTSGSKQ